MLPYVDYSDKTVWRDSDTGCPRLFLAPMEGVGDRFFRKAMAKVGGMDEICTEFLRVPSNAHIPSLAVKYNPHELGMDQPVAVQIMGQDPQLMGEMARKLCGQGAPRIDLNCGCPSNTVVGRGAGSSLLRTPEQLHRIAKAMVQAAQCPVSLKMRAGYDDTSLFHENVLAAAESGVVFITLHARTKAQRYDGKADWDLIARAKGLITIPLVGNGDIAQPSDAKQMLAHTCCDGIMIGRGAAVRPWIFHAIRADFAQKKFNSQWDMTECFLNIYRGALAEKESALQINKCKQMIHYLFQQDPVLQKQKLLLLRFNVGSAANLFEQMRSLLLQYYAYLQL